MKIMNTSKKQSQFAGFTLIEMIGVLAVIAILAALLLPKVANSISEAKVNNAASTYQTIQTAATDHYGKWNGFNLSNGTNLNQANLNAWDTGCLMPEGFLDKPLALKIGSSYGVHVVTGPQSNGGAGYSLDGTTIGTTNMAYVVEIAVTNVAPQDAYDLSTTLDGASLTPATAGTQDTKGRVTYDGSSILYMYIAGR